jgi:hypothetical protein
MLDRTRTRFADLSDEPCSGAHLLAPTDSKANYRHSVGSGAGPPLPANSMAALRSLAGSGATSQPQIIKDWRRRGGALVSAPCGTLGADAGGVELAFDERLFKESASGGSEMAGGGLMLRQPLGQVIPAWRMPPPLGGARAARRHLRAGHSLIFSSGAGP